MTDTQSIIEAEAVLKATHIALNHAVWMGVQADIVAAQAAYNAALEALNALLGDEE